MITYLFYNGIFNRYKIYIEKEITNMKTIVFVLEKGGVGKNVLPMNFTTSIREPGFRFVCILLMVSTGAG